MGLSCVALAAILLSAGMTTGQRLDGEALGDDVGIRVDVLFQYGMAVLTCRESGECVGFRLNGVDSALRLGGQVCHKAASGRRLDCGQEVGAVGASFNPGDNYTIHTYLHQPRRGQDDAKLYFGVYVEVPEGNKQLKQTELSLPLDSTFGLGKLWVNSDLGATQYVVPSGRMMGQPLLPGQSARVFYSTRLTAALGGDYSSRLRIALCSPRSSPRSSSSGRTGRCHVVQLLGSAATGLYSREAYRADSIVSTDWTTIRKRQTSKWPFVAGKGHSFVIERRSSQELAVWSEDNPEDVFLVPLQEDLVNLWVYGYSAVSFLGTEEPPTTLSPTTGSKPTTLAWRTQPSGSWRTSPEHGSGSKPAWPTTQGHSLAT